MKTSTKNDSKIIFICWLAYTAAYVGRLNFSASIVAVVEQMSITKAEAGLVGSFFFFAYGIGQLVNGILSKKYNPKIMIFISLAISSVLNLIMPISGSIEIMKYIWLLNGAVQSVLWCTLIKTISEKVDEKNIPKAIVVMSTTTPIGTFIAYGLSALFIKISAWQTVFYVASAILIITAFVWFTVYGECKNTLSEEAAEKNSSKISKNIVFAVIITAVAGIANGFVKDGVTTWVSSLFYEEFNISQSFSVMLTLLLPLVSVAGSTIVKKIHEKIKSHTAMNTIFFAVAAVLCAVILLALKMHSFAVLMACFMGIAILMAMVNNVITSIFPLDYRNLMGAGFLAGLLNTFCYVGSTITSYSLGSVAQEKGWGVTFTIMLAVCVAATCISSCGFLIKKANDC